MYRYTSDNPIILASASPRRKELLESAGLTFSIVKPECDESVLPGEKAEPMVRRLSLAKAEMIGLVNQEAWVIAADTTVYINSEILGKPESETEAFHMLSKISGNWHEVWGGFTIYNKSRNFSLTKAYCTKVLMRKLNENEILKFIESGEPMDKAGAYAIQGIGASLVSEIQGSYTNVVGLNLSAVISCLTENSIIK